MGKKKTHLLYTFKDNFFLCGRAKSCGGVLLIERPRFKWLEGRYCLRCIRAEKVQSAV